jgi:hypothetical protein
VGLLAVLVVAAECRTDQERAEKGVDAQPSEKLAESKIKRAITAPSTSPSAAAYQ